MWRMSIVFPPGSEMRERVKRASRIICDREDIMSGFSLSEKGAEVFFRDDQTVAVEELLADLLTDDLCIEVSLVNDVNKGNENVY
jgi:hypothetical protein